MALSCHRPHALFRGFQLWVTSIARESIMTICERTKKSQHHNCMLGGIESRLKTEEWIQILPLQPLRRITLHGKWSIWSVHHDSDTTSIEHRHAAILWRSTKDYWCNGPCRIGSRFSLLSYDLRGVDQRTKIEKGHCLELGKGPRCPLHRVAFT